MIPLAQRSPTRRGKPSTTSTLPPDDRDIETLQRNIYAMGTLRPITSESENYDNSSIFGSYSNVYYRDFNIHTRSSMTNVKILQRAQTARS